MQSLKCYKDQPNCICQSELFSGASRAFKNPYIFNLVKCTFQAEQRRKDMQKDIKSTFKLH